MPAATATRDIDDAKLKEDVEQLLDAMVNGEPTQSLEFAARLAAERAAAHQAHGIFKVWSVNNRLMLNTQVTRRGTSVKSLYAGVKQWDQMNREVVESELAKPYYIWDSPVYPRKKKDAAQNGTAQAAGTQNGKTRAARKATAPVAGDDERELVFGRPTLIKVYDWTQTRSLDPDYEEPNWDVPLGYGDLATLHGLIAASSVPVHFADLAAKNENGWLDATGITICDRMDVGNQISTLAHELGHLQLGHLKTITSTRGKAPKPAPDAEDDVTYSPRAVCEQEAAMVQWLVMKMLGLDESVGNQVTEQAAGYLSSWTKRDAEGNLINLEGKKSRRRLLTQRLNTAMKAADAIVSAYMAATDDVHAAADRIAAEATADVAVAATVQDPVPA